MTFNPELPFRVIDGVNVNITQAELDAHLQLQEAWVAEQAVPPIPDLATQLANLLIAKGTIASTDLNPTTLTAVNATLSAANLQTIS